MNKGEKWEVGGHTKGDDGVNRGRGGSIPNHLDLLFKERGGEGQRTGGEGRRRGGRGSRPR